MIITIPVFMNQFTVAGRVVTTEEKEALLAKRDRMLTMLKENPNLTTKEIAERAGENIRAVHGLLTAMQKQNKVVSTLTEQGRIWRVVDTSY